MSNITDRALVELLAKATPGEWKVGSTENYEFHVYVQDSSPIKYILKEVPEDMSNYDLRLMAVVKELAEEVLENRIKQRRLKEIG